MTVVAWDGVVMAADRMATFSGTPVRVRKVHRLVDVRGKPALFGVAGDANDAEAFVAWAKLQCESERYQPPEFKTLIAMRYSHKGLFTKTDNGPWVKINARRWAIGCGADYALGAMHAGASAIQAVEIASKLDIHCGMGVDVVRLK